MLDFKRKIVRKLFILTFLLIAVEAFAGAPWPPKQASELKGFHACDFPKDADIGFYSVPVPGRKGFTFNYRHKGESEQYVLLIKERGKDRCDGIIVGALKLPPFPPERHRNAPDESRWAVEFECRVLGRHWSQNLPAIGIVDQELPEGYFKPIRAWRVDTKKGVFVELEPGLVSCARFSDSGD
jgi:hypothetical protein